MFNKMILVSFLLFYSYLSFGGDSVYVCSLKPFIDSFSEAGRTEEYARLNVRNSCEKQHGEGSIFCRASDAKCELSFLGSSSVDGGNDASVVIYKYRHQTGPSLRVDDDISDLSMYRFDDDISSFSIPFGWRVRFYVDKNYQGNYYTRDHGSFNAEGFDDTISSIRIIHR
ncbi:hypothetical protein D8T49_05565 [Vibrio vulnificus]|uniref:beta/gamma crystallin-related protein n=1 Tax=Vibrio vulnificus TaxID=672 RepID=UPI0010233D60|nr:beta/gamma crystallin-related protein [Vibrio vulnificus]MCU8187013.1 beta/gamma crystallin-related protein [Vibrio vulnificus]MCU8195446.1 beta/gamma crystallin-related protein [Vibrio vulnificus]MCU8310018.1 beta/gamma crystallin-related protein [Vibrio vulnificus]RZQ05090.1 hypothetical protein D8T37_09475 [Vibrio vulnificus]RZQ50212.1 hypothetical protein D8T49_05565 [Vibrio vulnificus]